MQLGKGRIDAGCPVCCGSIGEGPRPGGRGQDGAGWRSPAAGYVSGRWEDDELTSSCISIQYL